MKIRKFKNAKQPKKNTGEYKPNHPAFDKAKDLVKAKIEVELSPWQKVKSTWDKAESFAKSVKSRGVTNEKVDGKTRSLRILSCHGDPVNGIDPCKARSYSENKKYHYCNQCGCGEREMARLDAIGSDPDEPKFNNDEYDKLDYPYLECPLKKEGFSNYVEPPKDTRRKLLLSNNLSPGDIVMLTAAVRDLHKSHGDKFAINVKTSCQEIWDSNPYITDFDRNDPDVENINCEYNLIHKSNQLPYHFIHGFRMDLEKKLGIEIPQGDFKGDIHISDKEKGWVSQIEEMGVKDKFWIMMAGGKYDFTTKWWNPDYYQEVVDHFKGKITFVQCGEKHHWHTPLNNVINLVGKTDIRQFLRLVYHSVGIVCPITFAMHAAAAVPVKSGNPRNRACVVIAGGRESTHWEAYPHHRYLSMVGSLTCCETGGCWRSRCQKVSDGDAKDLDQNLCLNPIEIKENLVISKCMNMIKPIDVIRAIESYYEGGTLEYGSSL
jgi:ADP-heptose:LPS heptosyltransferase